jgi:hypothetical protein
MDAGGVNVLAQQARLPYFKPILHSILTRKLFARYHYISGARESKSYMDGLIISLILSRLGAVDKNNITVQKHENHIFVLNITWTCPENSYSRLYTISIVTG